MKTIDIPRGFIKFDKEECTIKFGVEVELLHGTEFSMVISFYKYYLWILLDL